MTIPTIHSQQWEFRPQHRSSNTEVLNHVMTSQVPQSKGVGWKSTLPWDKKRAEKHMHLDTLQHHHHHHHHHQQQQQQQQKYSFSEREKHQSLGDFGDWMRCFDLFACQFQNSIFSSDDQSLHHFYCWVSLASPAWTSCPQIFGMKLRPTLQKTEKTTEKTFKTNLLKLTCCPFSSLSHKVHPCFFVGPFSWIWKSENSTPSIIPSQLLTLRSTSVAM